MYEIMPVIIVNFNYENKLVMLRKGTEAKQKMTCELPPNKPLVQ